MCLYVRTDNGFNNHLTGWLNGDFDGNGMVNFDDYVLIDLGFNSQNGTMLRAMSYADGTNTSTTGMNAPSLAKLRQHHLSFGNTFLQHFVQRAHGL